MLLQSATIVSTAHVLAKECHTCPLQECVLRAGITSGELSSNEKQEYHYTDVASKLSMIRPDLACSHFGSCKSVVTLLAILLMLSRICPKCTLHQSCSCCEHAMIDYTFAVAAA